MKKIFLISLMIFACRVFLVAQDSSVPKKDTINRLDANMKKIGYWEEKMADLVVKGYYNIKNKKVGNWLTFYISNSMISKLEYYENDQKNGISLKFDRKGHITGQDFYKNDLLNGLSVSYNAFGELPVSEINFTMGKKNGPAKWYYDNGKVKETDNYLDNLKQGQCQWYSQNGKLVAEYNYIKGQFDGVQKTYYENDTLQSLATYSNNVLSGLYKEFYRNGQPKISGNYMNGQKDGPWIDYDETGKAIKTSKFKNGVVK